MSTRRFWRRHKALALSGAFCAVCLLSLFTFWWAGFRVNLTPSLPRGLYRLTAEAPQRGDLVCFCLASGNSFSSVARERNYLGSGSCPSGLRPLLKELAGLPGDRISIAPGGLTLDGTPLANTARSETDRDGREVPPSLLRPGRIPDGFGLVISQEHAGSFDGRYFGLIPLASLKKAKPIFTF